MFNTKTIQGEKLWLSSKLELGVGAPTRCSLRNLWTNSWHVQSRSFQPNSRLWTKTYTTQTFVFPKMFSFFNAKILCSSSTTSWTVATSSCCNSKQIGFRSASVFVEHPKLVPSCSMHTFVRIPGTLRKPLLSKSSLHDFSARNSSNGISDWTKKILKNHPRTLTWLQCCSAADPGSEVPWEYSEGVVEAPILTVSKKRWRS